MIIQMRNTTTTTTATTATTTITTTTTTTTTASAAAAAATTNSSSNTCMPQRVRAWPPQPLRGAIMIKGPPEYCQDGTVTHLNYDKLL